MKFGLVSVSATASAESASVSASEAFASVAVARLAVEFSESAVVALGGLERQFGDVYFTFGALESERRHIMHLSLRSVLVIHFLIRLIC